MLIIIRHAAPGRYARIMPALQYAKTLHGAQTLQQYAQGNHLHKQATVEIQGQRVGQKAVRRV